MAYKILVRLASKNGYFTPTQARNYYGRYNRHGITWHWWGLPSSNPDSAHNNIVEFLYNQSVRGITSTNYVLSNTKLTLMVGPDNVAWASESGNPTTISVELSPNLNGAGYKRAGWLAQQLGLRYGGPRKYYRHDHWSRTQCPGTISLDRIKQEENKWSRGDYDKSTPPPEPTWKFVAKKGKAKVTGTGTQGLWVLRSPQLSGETVTVVKEGTMMDFVGYVTNGDSVNGNRIWWKNTFGNYFSSYYAPEYKAPAPAPEPTPELTPEPTKPILTPVEVKIMYTLPNAKLVDIETMKAIKTFDLDTPIDIGGESTWEGNKFYISRWAYDNDKAQGFLVGDLKDEPTPIPKPEPEKPEWEKYLRDIDETPYWLKKRQELIDITTGKPSGDKIFEKNEPFVASASTVSNGVEYRITEYSFSRGIFKGVPINSITLTEPGEPDIEPIPDNPDLINKSVVIAFLQSLIELISNFIAKIKN